VFRSLTDQRQKSACNAPLLLTLLSVCLLTYPTPSDAAPPAGAERVASRYGVACQSGLFRIFPIVSGTEVDPDILPFIGLEVEMVGGQLAILDHCDPAPANMKLTREGTEIHANWRRCAGFPRGLGLRGTIDESTCSLLTGQISAPGVAGQIPFTGQQRLVSGDTNPGSANPDDDSGRTSSSSRNQVIHKRFQRWYSGFYDRAYPAGFIPPGALEEGFEAVVVAPSALEHWVSLGPAPSRAKPGDASESISTIASGAVRAVAVDPSDPEHWLIGANNGGVWETSDSGTSWLPRTDDQPTLIISALAFSTSASHVAYAGTGTYLPTASEPRPGAGILKSTDGGKTWNLLGQNVFSGLGFGGIAVHPTLPGTVVAATVDSIPGAFYEVYLPPGAGVPGVYRSVTGGTSWQRTLDGQATALVSHPSSPSFYLYAGLQQPAGQRLGFPHLVKSGVFRSLDGGQSWTSISGPWQHLPGGIGEVRLAVSPSDPATLYVSIRDAANKKGKDGYLLGVWKTENAWDPAPAWTALPTPVITPYGLHALLVHNSDPDILYLASGGPPLWKWVNDQWLAISQQDPTNANSASLIHVDHTALAWIEPDSLLVGNDGGVYLKDEVYDGPWMVRNDGLAITHFRGGAVYPTDLNTVLGGAWDNGAMLMLPPAGPVWRKISTGDGQGGFFGFSTEQLAFFLQYGIVERSLDGGNTYTNALAGIPTNQLGGSWFTQAVPCPADPDQVLYAGARLWKSANFFSEPDYKKVTWTPSIPVPVGVLTAIAFAPSDTSCRTYAYANKQGKLALTMDDGEHWYVLNTGSELPPRIPTALAFAPDNADTLWVTFSGYDAATPANPGHVFRTDDASAASPTWTDVSPPADVPFNAIALHPTDANIAYAGCDLGAWSTADAGANWVHHGPSIGMPNVPVMALHVGNCRTTAFTLGRGAFRTSSLLPFCTD